MAIVGKVFNALKRLIKKTDAFDLVIIYSDKKSLEKLEETLLLSDIGFEIVEKIVDVIKKDKQDNFISDLNASTSNSCSNLSKT